MFGGYVIKQYERSAVFKLGKVQVEAREPGLMFCVPRAANDVSAGYLYPYDNRRDLPEIRNWKWDQTG